MTLKLEFRALKIKLNFTFQTRAKTIWLFLIHTAFQTKDIVLLNE